MSIDTSQLDAAARDLKAGGKRVGAKAAAILRRGVGRMESTMKATVEVRSGATRDSISTSYTGDGRSGTMTAESGPTKPSAEFLEEGTSEMPAEPFVGPAFDKHIGPLLDEFATLGDELMS